MKKIKYIETNRSNTNQYEFVECEGWVDTFYDVQTNTPVNIVFRKCDSLMWKATHLESGMVIISGYTTKKGCVEGILMKIGKIAYFLNNSNYVQGVMKELEKYKNEVMIHAFN